MTKMVRKQVFITAEQNKKLKARAAATGVAEAELIRAGIDLRLEQELEKQRPWREVVDETLAKLSGAWAERENLDEEMREIRSRWNRRSTILGKRAKRPS
jgi:ribbon-helix-helix protein